jgi:hypothetical protein
MPKNCPLLSRYKVGRDDPCEGSATDWKKRICTNCPVSQCVILSPGPARSEDMRMLAVASLNPFRGATMPTLSVFWR